MAKIDKKFFDYEKLGRDRWRDLGRKAMDAAGIHWAFENDDPVAQKNVSIETPEDAWESNSEPGKMLDEKASFKCELRFAGGDWEQGVYYFCCQSVKGPSFHSGECLVLIPTKEQGNLSLVDRGDGKWTSSQMDEKNVEYDRDEAEKLCWESLPDMLMAAKKAKDKELKKSSLKEVNMDRGVLAHELVRLAAELSPKQKKYREYFDKKLKETGKESPADMTEEEKKKFFEDVDKGWKGEEE